LTSAPLTFPVCTFKRVFDTSPVREVLTLSELVACFRRFELKPQLHARIEREVQRIDRALDQALAGETVGERVSEIAAAGRGGTDPQRAMRAKAEEMRVLARKEAKRDLRLWSPALYRDDAVERGTEGVTHVSCLVLDYDAGARIPEATAPFAGYFHLVHTTWSHSPAHPKFRVILPLAAPVPADKWEDLWKWAHRESGGEIDVAMSGAAANYALPATPYRDAAREALSNPAPILDPRDLGIEIGEPVRLAPLHAPVSSMRGDPEKEYVEEGAERALYVYDDPIDDWDPDGPAATPLRAAPEASNVIALDESDLPSQRLAIAERVTHPDVPPPPIEPPSALPRRVGRVRTKRVAKKTIVVDFDGVLHSYASGWKGATVVTDAPVEGALDWLAAAVERFDVAIYSSRSREKGGIEAMRDWLAREGLAERVLDQLKFPRTKVPAHVYIDDRGWRFEGTFPALDVLDELEPWFKRR
jgi:hypothetical protein